MSTSRPPIDPFNPVIQLMVREFELEFCPGGDLDSHSNDAGRSFNESFKRPYVCALMTDVMSGQWQMGTSQEEISERLGILSDRGWVSHALHQGRMSMDVYMRLRCWPSRPKDWEPDVNALARDMHRSGFIGAARSFAGLVATRPTLVPQRLDELTYELVCELHGTLESWSFASIHGDTRLAAELVNNVCQDARRNISPAWYTAKQRRAVDAEIQRLISDPSAAFEHLRLLQVDWLDVFAATDAWLEHEDRNES